MNDVDRLFKALGSDRAKVRYGASKKLLAMAEKTPERLYPRFDSFVELWDSENRIFRWTGILIVGRLARVDAKGKADRRLGRLVSFLRSGDLITANNAILALGDVAENKPGLRSRIIDELLKVEKYKFETAECRNIAVGKVVQALARFADELACDKDVRGFLRRAARSRRNSTRKKALDLLGRMEPCCASCGR